jgi:hypothetical protein
MQLLMSSALLSLSVASGPAFAQREANPASQPAQVDVALQVGNSAYRASGPGECKASREASIYGVRASLYSAAHNSGRDRLRLTLWQPTDGSGKMVGLHVSLDGKSYEVDTVKGSKTARPVKGSATVKVEPTSAGGTFSIDAAAGDGTKIMGTIRCSHFGRIVAEGG